MIDPDVLAQAKALGGTIFACALFVLAFWFKANRSKNDVDEGRAKIDILHTAIEERDKMAEKLNDALHEIRQLSADNSRMHAENVSLRENHDRMQVEINRLRSTVEQLQRIVRARFPGMPDEAFSTGPAPLE